MKIYLILLIIAFLTITSQAQVNSKRQHKVDSLQQVITNAKHDTIAINAYKVWAELLVDSNPVESHHISEKAKRICESGLVNPDISDDVKLFYNTSIVTFINTIGSAYLNQAKYDLALEYNQNALALSKQLDFKKGIAKSFNGLGIVQSRQGDYPKALDYYQQALKISEEIGDKESIAYTSNNIGIIHNRQGNHPKTLEYYQRALKISEEIRDKNTTPVILGNIGAVYFRQENFQKALEYYQRALKIHEEMGNKKHIAIILNNQGSVYYYKKDYPKALEYFQRSVKINEEIGNKEIIAVSLSNIGDIYREQDNYNSALAYYQRALKIGEEIENKVAICFQQTNIANIYFNLGQLTTALPHAQKAHNIAVEIGDPLNIRESSMQLYNIYKQQRKFQKALTHYETYIVMRDSLVNEKNKKALYKQELNYKYEKEQETQRSEQEKKDVIFQANLKRQQAYAWSGGIIALLFLGMFVLAFRNIQHRKRRNLQLLELDKTKTKLYANVSHEFRTPLTLIRSPLEDSKDGRIDKRDHHMMLTNVGKLQNLVDSILDLSKLESGAKLSLSKNRLHLSNYINRTFFSYQSLADELNLKLNLDYRLPQKVWIKADTNKVTKVLDNLLTNAIKNTTQGGIITTLVMLEGKYLKLAITDTGNGIHHDDLPYVFNRYYQSSKNQDNDIQGGTGIGLALAKEYAQLMEGKIEVQSVLNKGTTFTLYIPFEETEPQEQKIEKLPETALEEEIHYQPTNLQNSIKPCLLIVEDQKEMRNYLFRKLEYKYLILLAGDGIQGLEKLENNHVDFILSDVMMPNMDGFTFREEINEHETWNRIPFIIFTARGDENDKIRGFKLGIDDYINKPFNLMELEARMDNLLQNKQNRLLYEKECKEDKEPIKETLTARKKLVQQAEKLVLDNLSNEDYKVTDLCEALSYSQRQLDRILKQETGLTPVAFIREIRLQQAYKYLSDQTYLSVKEVRYEVGICHASYFTKVFTKRFGKSPKEIMGSYQNLISPINK